MSCAGNWLLITQAWWSLARFDLLVLTRKGTGVEPLPAVRASRRAAPVERIIAAHDTAICLYWKPVRCLQRSVSLARRLRANAVDAEVVIGVRFAPLTSHAWLEVDGHSIDGGAGYARRWQELCRL